MIGREWLSGDLQQGSGHILQFRRKIRGAMAAVDANADYRPFHKSGFAADGKLCQDTAKLFTLCHQIICPFDLRTETGAGFYRITSGNGGSTGGNAGYGGSTGGNGGGSTTATGGGTLSVENAVKGEDNVWSIPVEVAPQYLSATELSFTVKYDATKGTFQGVKGLEEGTYTVEEVAPGELVIKITDFKQVKALKAGDKFFEILIKTNDGIEKLDEISLDLADAYTYLNTGDGMVFIIVAVAVSVLGCAIVIGKRRSAVR